MEQVICGSKPFDNRDTSGTEYFLTKYFNNLQVEIRVQTTPSLRIEIHQPNQPKNPESRPVFLIPSFQFPLIFVRRLSSSRSYILRLLAQFDYRRKATNIWGPDLLACSLDRSHGPRILGCIR